MRAERQGLHSTVPRTGPRQDAGRNARGLAPPRYGIDFVDGGLPHDLVSGVQALSGLDVSDVRVHANSGKPAQLHAVAYTQGNEIHVAPGQEKHLPHEAWHVVQQRQGRVQPTLQLKGVRINDDGRLESEAQAMGERALRAGADTQPGTRASAAPGIAFAGNASQVVMRQPAPEAKEEKEEGPGFWGTIGGGLMGEFNEDPNYAMIGVDLGVSLVPILDQASDIRDVIAHLYYLIVKRQYDSVMRWIGLAFTLIGLFPEIGSAIKGASKFVLKGVREVISHIADFLRPLRKIFPEIADVGRFRRYIARHWDRIVSTGIDAWNRAVGRVAKLAGAASVFFGGIVRRIRDGIARIREIAPQKLADAFGWVRRKLDDVLGEAGERLGVKSADEELALAGGGKVPPNVFMSEAKGVGAVTPTRTTMTTVEELKPPKTPRGEPGAGAREGPFGARPPGSKSRYGSEEIVEDIAEETGKASSGARALEETGVAARHLRKVDEYHHLLVQQLRTWFRERGVNIDDFTVKLSADEHRWIHNEYRWNDLWKDFRRKSPNAKPEEIIAKMRELQKQVGLEGLEIVPYPK